MFVYPFFLKKSDDYTKNNNKNQWVCNNFKMPSDFIYLKMQPAKNQKYAVLYAIRYAKKNNIFLSDVSAVKF